MSFGDIVTLTLVIMLLAALPSSSVVLVVARSTSAGRRHGVAVTLGIVLADLIFMALAIAASRIAIRANGTALQSIMQRGAGVAMVGTGSWLILKP